MSKFNIEFDTETKQVSVQMNGKELPDVVGVHIYRYKMYEPDEEGNEYCCDISVEMASEEEGVMVRKMMTANHKDYIPQEVKLGLAKQAPFDKTVYLAEKFDKLVSGASKMLGRS